jgi:hypothetical protein
MDFQALKSLQYCDNPNCTCFEQIGLGNICTLSQKNNQVYCNKCKNRWVLSKNTFFYDLRTDDKVILRVLTDLSEGKSHRAIYRTDKVSLETQKRWIERAAEHVAPISAYLEREMHLTRVQIDEFWSFIYKKKGSLPNQNE